MNWLMPANQVSNSEGSLPPRLPSLSLIPPYGFTRPQPHSLNSTSQPQWVKGLISPLFCLILLYLALCPNLSSLDSTISRTHFPKIVFMIQSHFTPNLAGVSGFPNWAPHAMWSKSLLTPTGDNWLHSEKGIFSPTAEPLNFSVPNDVFVLAELIYTYICSCSSMVGLMATSSKRAYAKPKSAAPRAPVPAAVHCWPVPPQETLKHKFCLSLYGVPGFSQEQ